VRVLSWRGSSSVWPHEQPRLQRRKHCKLLQFAYDGCKHNRLGDAHMCMCGTAAGGAASAMPRLPRVCNNGPVHLRAPDGTRTASPHLTDTVGAGKTHRRQRTQAPTQHCPGGINARKRLHTTRQQGWDPRTGSHQLAMAAAHRIRTPDRNSGGAQASNGTTACTYKAQTWGRCAAFTAINRHVRHPGQVADTMHTCLGQSPACVVWGVHGHLWALDTPHTTTIAHHMCACASNRTAAAAWWHRANRPHTGARAPQH
jgi:hypothetical protein